MQNKTTAEKVVTVKRYTVTAEPNAVYYAVFYGSVRLSRAYKHKSTAIEQAKVSAASYGAPYVETDL